MKKLVKNFYFIFDLENQIYEYTHHHIRDQRLKIRKYGEFDRKRKLHLLWTAPLMDFGSFFF